MHLPDYRSTIGKVVLPYFCDQYDNRLWVTEMMHCLTYLFPGSARSGLMRQKPNSLQNRRIVVVHSDGSRQNTDL